MNGDEGTSVLTRKLSPVVLYGCFPIDEHREA